MGEAIDISNLGSLLQVNQLHDPNKSMCVMVRQRAQNQLVHIVDVNSAKTKKSHIFKTQTTNFCTWQNTIELECSN